MDWVVAVILLVLVVIGGSLAGLVALSKARRALREIAALRVLVGSMQATGPAAYAAPEPAAVPLPAVPPEPVSQPEAALAFEVPPDVPQATAEDGPPLAAPAPVAAPAGMDLELLLTQRWGVWVGAVALLLSAVFLVRYVVAHSTVGPGARCVMTGLLGVALVGAAEWMRRRPTPALALVDYAPSALAAGGVGALFAAAYAAGPLYALVSPVAGFVLLGAAGVAGLALSLRFGPLVGALGLAAAFGTPALVATDDPSLPGLFAYLLVVTAASWAVVRLTAWTWLGWAAAAGGAAWVLLVTLGVSAPSGVWAAGLFVPAATALSLALLPGAALEHPVGRRFAWAPMLMLGLAGVALAAAAGARGGDPVVRAGLLLLAPIAMAKGWREPRLAWLPLVSAGLAVLTLLVWALPAWQAAGEAVSIEGVVQAVLPGTWAPGVIRPLLICAALVALLHAVVGLAGERMTPRPLPWAALAAGVPVVVLGVAYAQVGAFQSQPAWAVLALACAAGLAFLARLARRGAVVPVQRAGVYATGVVAALALGAAILLDDAWLTLALALLLPGLAWIEASADLPPLRRVALVVAGVLLVRLILNPWVAAYAVGTTPMFNGLLVAYGLPALCCGVAAWRFRRRADDRLVAVLEAVTCAFGVLLLVLEEHHAAHGGQWVDWDVGPGEQAWQVSGLGAVAVLLQAVAAGRGRPVLDATWRLIGGVALAGGVFLLVRNPFMVSDGVGTGLVLNGLLPAYFIPAALAALALRGGNVPVRLLGGYALLAVFVGVSAEVRQVFHPGTTAFEEADIVDAELWAYSGAWLLLAAALMGAGAALRWRSLRLAGLALTGLVVAKVFLVDMSGLDGLWRVLSFLGLGLGLIGLGALYRRFAAKAAV